MMMMTRKPFILFVFILLAPVCFRAQTFSDTLLTGSWKIAYYSSAAGKSFPRDTTLTCSYYADKIYQDYDHEREQYSSEKSSAMVIGKMNVTYQASWSLDRSVITLSNAITPDSYRKQENLRKKRKQDPVKIFIVSLAHDSLVVESMTDKSNTKNGFNSQVHYYRVKQRPKKSIAFEEENTPREKNVKITNDADYMLRHVSNARRTIRLRNTQLLTIHLLPPVYDSAYTYYEYACTGYPDSMDAGGFYIRLSSEKYVMSGSKKKSRKGENYYGKYFDSLPVFYAPWNRIQNIGYMRKPNLNAAARSLTNIAMAGVMIAPLSAIRIRNAGFDTETYLATAGTFATLGLITAPTAWLTRTKKYSLCNGGTNGRWLLTSLKKG